MANAVAMMIGGAVVNALAFSGSNYLFSHLGTRFPSYQYMYQVWLKSLHIYSSCRQENENMGMSRADNSVKI